MDLAKNPISKEKMKRLLKYLMMSIVLLASLEIVAYDKLGMTEKLVILCSVSTTFVILNIYMPSIKVNFK